MENVNNLNGIPNFGHGLPEDGIVEAGITDVPQEVAQFAEDPETAKEPLEEVPEESEEVEITNQE